MLRRSPAVLLVGLLGLALLGLLPGTPVARTLAATSGVTGVVADPDCVPLDDTPDTQDQVEVGLDGHGFEPGSTVEVYVGQTFDAGQLPVTEARVDGLGHVRVRVPVVLPTEPTTIPIALSTPGDGPYASLELAAPCPPRLTVDPTCSAPDGTFSLDFRAEGFQPDSEMYVGIVLPEDFDPNQAPIVSEALTADGDGRLEYRMEIPALPAGVYQAAAVGGEANVARIAAAATRNPYVAATPIELPCPDPPRIALTPDCAPVGQPQDRTDVTVQGVGFRYGPATVTWDVGGSQEEFPVELIGDDGILPVRIDPWQRPRGRIVVRVTQRFPVGEDTPNGFGAYATELRPPLVAEAVFRVPCRPTATPSMTLDADCDTPAVPGDTDRRMSIDVRATALPPGSVDIVFDADGSATDVLDPETFQGQVGDDGELSATIEPLARPVGEYRVAIVVDGASVSDATFRVPCEDPSPALRPLVPECAPLAPGQPDSVQLLVRGRGYYPGIVEVVVDPRGSPDAVAAEVVDDGTFEATIGVTGRDRGEYQVVGRQRDTRGTIVARATRVLTVPCVEPTLVIEPPFGPAGYSAIVTGTDFPPDSIITLTWDRGLTASRPTEVTVDDSGGFRIGVFVLPHDLDGPRVLTAGTPADPAAFPDATVDYLVTLGTGQPPHIPGR